MRMSCPRSSRWMEKECQKVWQLATLLTPAADTARLTAFCTTLGSRGWRPSWCPVADAWRVCCVRPRSLLSLQPERILFIPLSPNSLGNHVLFGFFEVPSIVDPYPDLR